MSVCNPLAGNIPAATSEVMPMLCRRASVSRLFFSRSESSWWSVASFSWSAYKIATCHPVMQPLDIHITCVSGFKCMESDNSRGRVQHSILKDYIVWRFEYEYWLWKRLKNQFRGFFFSCYHVFKVQNVSITHWTNLRVRLFLSVALWGALFWTAL